MTNRRNIGASVRVRLLERAHEQKADFQILLTRYTLERLLYRLSLSVHRDRFILKGAMLFSTWVETPFGQRGISIFWAADHLTWNPSPRLSAPSALSPCLMMASNLIQQNSRLHPSVRSSNTVAYAYEPRPL